MVFRRSFRVRRHAHFQKEVFQEIAEGVIQEIKERKVTASNER